MNIYYNHLKEIRFVSKCTFCTCDEWIFSTFLTAGYSYMWEKELKKLHFIFLKSLYKNIIWSHKIYVIIYLFTHRISDFSLETATLDFEVSSKRALSVEQCQCPPNYKGILYEMFFYIFSTWKKAIAEWIMYVNDYLYLCGLIALVIRQSILI